MVRNRKGFTIIEVVLVLAIGGLIFLMVFVALPNLQRNQRNTQRREDMSRLITAAERFRANNNGKSPFLTQPKWGLFFERYVDSSIKYKEGYWMDNQVTNCGDQFRDPDGTCYQIYHVGHLTDGSVDKEVGGLYKFDHTIRVYSNAKCGATEQRIDYVSGKNQYALILMLEGGQVYCGDNS